MDATTEQQQRPIKTGLVHERFGIVAEPGFQPLPHILMVHQADLELTSEELNVVLHIMAHWFDRERLPYPRVSTIAKRMGVSERSVQRSISRLVARGLLVRVREGGRYGVTKYDPKPLVQKLEPFAESWVIRHWNARKDTSLEKELEWWPTE